MSSWRRVPVTFMPHSETIVERATPAPQVTSRSPLNPAGNCYLATTSAELVRAEVAPTENTLAVVCASLPGRRFQVRDVRLARGPKTTQTTRLPGSGRLEPCCARGLPWTPRHKSTNAMNVEEVGFAVATPTSSYEHGTSLHGITASISSNVFPLI